MFTKFHLVLFILICTLPNNHILYCNTLGKLDTLLLELKKIPLISTNHRENCNFGFSDTPPLNANNTCNLLQTLTMKMCFNIPYNVLCYNNGGVM